MLCGMFWRDVQWHVTGKKKSDAAWNNQHQLIQLIHRWLLLAWASDPCHAPLISASPWSGLLHLLCACCCGNARGRGSSSSCKYGHQLQPGPSHMGHGQLLSRCQHCLHECENSFQTGNTCCHDEMQARPLSATDHLLGGEWGCRAADSNTHCSPAQLLSRLLQSGVQPSFDAHIFYAYPSHGPRSDAQSLMGALQVCGAVIPQDQRLQLDAMAAHMASTAFAAAEGLAAAVETGARESLAAPLQLAACKALVASILAPAPHSPAFLPLALRLLRQVGDPMLMGAHDHLSPLASHSSLRFTCTHGGGGGGGGHTHTHPPTHPPHPFQYMGTGGFWLLPISGSCPLSVPI